MTNGDLHRGANGWRARAGLSEGVEGFLGELLKPGSPAHRAAAGAVRRYRHLRGWPAARTALRRRAPRVVEFEPAAYPALLRCLARGCTTVLDVGTGLMHSLRDSPCRVRVGLDVHRPYLEHRLVRDAVPINADALALTELFVPGAVDLVTLIDVIEHFPREKALTVLKQAETIAAKRTVVATPRGFFPQRDHDAFALGGETFQEHRSTWDVPDLLELGYRVAIVKALHTRGNASFVEAFGPDAPPVDGLVAWKEPPPAQRG